MWQVARFPVDLHRQPLRGVFTYVLPVALIASVPAGALVHRPAPLLGPPSLAAGMGAVLAANAVWRAGLRRYTGATS
jgi:ABC-2 type transport system permease protein